LEKQVRARLMPRDGSDDLSVPAQPKSLTGWKHTNVING